MPGIQSPRSRLAVSTTKNDPADVAEGSERSVPVDPRDRFDSLFTAFFDDVLAYAGRRTATPQDAEDATAEVFVVAWRRLSDVPRGEAARYWLLATCRRILANTRRGAGRRDRLLARLRNRRPDDGLLNPPEGGIAVAALATLSDDDQELLRLFAWEELEVRELAQVLGLSPNAAAVRLHRARRRLQDAYRQLGGR